MSEVREDEQTVDTPVDSAEENPWEEVIVEDHDEADEGDVSEEPSPAEETEAEAPESESIAEEPPQTVTPAEEEPTPAEPAPEAQEPAAQEPPAEEPPKPAEPEPEIPQPAAKTEEERRQEYEVYLGQLEQYYQIPEQDLDNFLEEPGKALSSLAARMHASVVDTLTQTFGETLQQALPGMIVAVQQRQQSTNELWNEVQSTFGDFAQDRANHGVLRQATEIFYNDPANRSKSAKEAARGIGMLAWTLKGNSPAELVALLSGQESAAQTDPAPISAPEPTGGFSPPSSGRTGAPPPARKSNVYEEFIGQIERGDYETDDPD